MQAQKGRKTSCETALQAPLFHTATPLFKSILKSPGISSKLLSVFLHLT